ncbi:MAG: MFS transporter, partial [Bacteroidetes bacterium]|nr:MFS transporter [Bacteroidota bacterium]
MFFAVISGFGAMAQNTLCITIIQVESSPAMRGRMMSYVAFAYFGMLPLGSLLIGSVSQKIGAPNALLCQGIFSLAIIAVFFTFFNKDIINKRNIKQLEEAEEIVLQKI